MKKFQLKELPPINMAEQLLNYLKIDDYKKTREYEKNGRYAWNEKR